MVTLPEMGSPPVSKRSRRLPDLVSVNIERDLVQKGSKADHLAIPAVALFDASRKMEQKALKF